jgi:signal transduction histidine kinase
VLVDAVLTAAALGGSLLPLSQGFGSARSGSELDLPSGTLAACATVPLLAWRRAPFGVFVVIAVASTLAAGLGYALGVPLGPAAALYLLAARRDETRPWTPRAAGVVVALFTAFLTATAAARGSFPGVDLVHSGLPWAVAWFAGERTRLRREHIAALEERVVRAEHEAEQERLLAVAEERARIARDLHDSAGHAINVIAVRAGAARLRHPQDPERSRLALAAIEEIARQTVEEIDQLVGTLRDSGSPNSTAVEAPPGLASLDTLIAHYAAAGLAVTIATAGTPQPLGAAIDQAAYRILQEALTNAARHGAGAVRIELVFGDTSLGLTGHQSGACQSRRAVLRRARCDRYARAGEPARRHPRRRARQQGIPRMRPASLPGPTRMTRVLIAADDDLMRAGPARIIRWPHAARKWPLDVSTPAPQYPSGLRPECPYRGVTGQPRVVAVNAEAGGPDRQLDVRRPIALGRVLSSRPPHACMATHSEGRRGPHSFVAER